MLKKSSFRAALEQLAQSPAKSQKESSSQDVNVILWPKAIKQPTSVVLALRRYGLTLRKAHSVINRLAEGANIAVRLSDKFVEQAKKELAELGIDLWVVKRAIPDPKQVRDKLGISQDEFAARYCLEVATVQNWEQGRSGLDPAAQMLLRIIDKCPGVVESVAVGREVCWTGGGGYSLLWASSPLDKQCTAFDPVKGGVHFTWTGEAAKPQKPWVVPPWIATSKHAGG